MPGSLYNDHRLLSCRQHLLPLIAVILVTTNSTGRMIKISIHREEIDKIMVR
jgi:hypothetical protein